MRSQQFRLPVRSPKRDASNLDGRASWYPYYAGYSPNFVQDAIGFAKSRQDVTKILDPWNGSGTTTQVAQFHDLEAEGFDINPAMVLVAKARLLGREVQGSIASLLDDICSKANKRNAPGRADPLTMWLTASSAAGFRSLERAISTLLVCSDDDIKLASLSSLGEISSLASFFYVGLFRAIRSVVKPFCGSNPTWIRKAASPAELRHVTRQDSVALFRKEISWMARLLERDESKGQRIRIDIATATALPVKEPRFDLIVSSPPYCTRIDYAVKCLPELALLGLSEASFRVLRTKMLGTPTIDSIQRLESPAWGKYCRKTLNQIRQHQSRASVSYYLKTYVQYFDGLSRALAEMSRVMLPNGLCFLVLQDSFYKEVHVDLARICAEMCDSVGLSPISRIDFSRGPSMMNINSAARGYTQTRRPTETVLLMNKTS
jgi:SAM-dependent methyltransferase